MYLFKFKGIYVRGAGALFEALFHRTQHIASHHQHFVNDYDIHIL